MVLEINTQKSKLRDLVDKIVTAKLGMNLPLIMHGASLLYEVGDDLDDIMVANYNANLEKVGSRIYSLQIQPGILQFFLHVLCFYFSLYQNFLLPLSMEAFSLWKIFSKSYLARLMSSTGSFSFNPFEYCFSISFGF